MGLGDDAGPVLGVVGRQVAWLNLIAPRPQLLTQLQAPAYTTDVAALAVLPDAAIAVIEGYPGQTILGGDLLWLDLTAHALAPLVLRATPEESLGSPAWMPDGSRLFFDRADLTGTPIQYPGQTYAYYPSRIEVVPPKGSGRSVVVEAARSPSVSPDGTQLAYLRSTVDGTALVVRTLGGDGEQVPVPSAQFANLAYPRYSPDGQRIAFMAPGVFVAQTGWVAHLPFAPSVGYAHGQPWDLWMVDVDGTHLHQVAELGADDASLSWSPDGTQILVYGGSGSALVDPVTGETDPLGYLAGYGSTAWVVHSSS